MNKRLIDRWTEFLTRDPLTLTEDELQQAETDGNSSLWENDPVSAYAPERCEEFRQITRDLSIAYDLGTTAHANAYVRTPALFQAGCDFGEAVEKMREAREEDDHDGLTTGMVEARTAWAKIAQLTWGT